MLEGMTTPRPVPAWANRQALLHSTNRYQQNAQDLPACRQLKRRFSVSKAESRCRPLPRQSCSASGQRAQRTHHREMLRASADFDVLHIELIVLSKFMWGEPQLLDGIRYAVPMLRRELQAVEFA